MSGLVGMTDSESYGQRVVNQVIRNMERIPPTTVPGVVVIQVDGMPFPLLAAQVRAGTLTTMARWIRSGDPRLRVQVNNVFGDDHQWPSGYSYLYYSANPDGTRSLNGTPYYYPLATRSVFVSLDLRF